MAFSLDPAGEHIHPRQECWAIARNFMTACISTFKVIKRKSHQPARHGGKAGAVRIVKAMCQGLWDLGNLNHADLQS